MRTALAILILLLTTTAHSQVYRCTVDGRTVFSDQPCAESGPTVGQVLEEQRARLQAEQAREDAITAECAAWLDTAPTVTNSAWDASVHQVKTWLNRNAHDPRSLQFVAWSRVVRHCHGYAVQVQYRARNAFGGMILESRIVRLNRNGEVIGSDVIDWTP